MSLERRIARIENLADHWHATDDEFRDAMALCRRHFEAFFAPKYLGTEPDPLEVALLSADEASGQIARAVEVIDRWKRAQGIDPEEEARRGTLQ